MLFSLKMSWWKLLTWLRLTLDRDHRTHWSKQFSHDPRLTAARSWVGTKEHHALAGETFAGFYNDHVEHGHLSVRRALKIYYEGEL